MAGRFGGHGLLVLRAAFAVLTLFAARSLLRRQVPHPFGMYEEPMHFDTGRWLAQPRWFIDCVAPAYPTISEPRRRARTQPGWVVREMETGHCPMVSRPVELVALLLEAAEAAVLVKNV